MRERGEDGVEEIGDGVEEPVLNREHYVVL